LLQKNGKNVRVEVYAIGGNIFWFFILFGYWSLKIELSGFTPNISFPMLLHFSKKNVNHSLKLAWDKALHLPVQL
jgi:hypothetical protein